MGGARGVIALVIGAGTLGADRGARDHLNRAFVETFEGDAVAGGRPPGPGRAAELLLRDEFGGAACDRPLAVGRALRLAPVRDRPDTRRVGPEGVRTFRLRWSPVHQQK